MSGRRSGWRPPQLLWQLLAIASIATTLYLSLAPSLPRLPGIRISDKLGHVLAYAVNGLLVAAAISDPKRLRNALLALFAMGVGLELWQSQLSAREGSWLDAGANTLGLAAGGLVWLLRRRN